MKTRLTRPLVAAFLVMAALALGSVVPAARSSDLMGASLTYTVSDGAAANTTRVAGSNEMSYPRLAVDRDPTSPFAGTMYVAGLDNITCASLVVRRSSDGGRTFRDPLRSDLCLRVRRSTWPLVGTGRSSPRPADPSSFGPSTVAPPGPSLRL